MRPAPSRKPSAPLNARAQQKTPVPSRAAPPTTPATQPHWPKWGARAQILPATKQRHPFYRCFCTLNMDGAALSIRRREKAASAHISIAPTKKLGNVYMTMTDFENYRKLKLLLAQTTTFHEKSLNKGSWKMRYDGRCVFPGLPVKLGI